MPEETLTQPDTLISYDEAIDYWSSIPATDNGVLGGFANTSLPRADIHGSKTFIKRLLTQRPEKLKYEGTKHGVDIGAGIGRVTRDLLHEFCDVVDLVEPVENFVAQMDSELSFLKEKGKIGDIYAQGMQDFVPTKGKYWLIWCQWCVGHLPDKELIHFLKRCTEGLVPNGIIILKENNSSQVDDIFDDVDSSVIRTDGKFKQLFEESGLNLIGFDQQKGFPKGLYPVRMYALQPKA